ncbi:MAG: hypothetical protein IT560_09650 [Alphaproteobacteria bacterium]|nr:hypothetical protein [Alphaproteobacteria bacterium]
MEIAQMITGNRPLPSFKTLQTEIFALLTRFAGWLDCVLAPFESEAGLSLAPALVPVRISQTRTRRTTAARIYQRRRIATRIAFAMQELMRPSEEKQAAYPHKWAERVSKRRQPAAAAAKQIRFSANSSSSQPLTSAPSMAARHARGADAFSGLHLARKISHTGGLHRAAFTPRPMSG